MLLIGIDEAGYGPLLGPLLISAVAMKLPEELIGMSLWQLFKDVVSEKPKGAKGRLIIADSKKVFTGKRRDIRQIERSALAGVLLACGKLPESLDELLQSISMETEPHLLHPWYCHQTLNLPHKADKQGLQLSTSLLQREMKSAGCKLTTIKTVPLVEKKYNYLVEQTRNKSQVLFSQTARLVTEIMEDSSEKHVRVCVDKQGGKDRYLRDLLRVFPSANLKVINESEKESIYHLEFPNRFVEIYFCQAGELQHLLVAWASIVSKYIRELFMLQFNSYWLGFDETLRPTAGYWKDGQRFVKDIDPLLRRMNISTNDLVRRM